MSEAIVPSSDQRSCFSILKTRFAITLILGILIGTAGLAVVEDPPSTQLLHQELNRSQDTRTIMEKLNSLTMMIDDLRTDVSDIKQKIKK